METTDIIICGCGPTGAMLSANLGLLGVKNICLDKEQGITHDPRGIALDEDGIRALQGIGIYDQIHTDIGQCMGKFNFVGGVHNNLQQKPFMVLDYGTSEGGTGHVGFICHKQPVLEKHIRGVMKDLPKCQLREGCTLTGITEDADWVYATYRDQDQVEGTIRGRFLVGSDGKTGFCRKKYLESKGIVMEQSSATPYSETWVATNWRMKVPTPDTHPDFPLWKLGYSSEDVYNLFFPKDFRFLCNPQRAAVCGRFGLTEDRLWRFEFVVRTGENGKDLSMEQNLNKIVYPYIIHPGSRYGLLSPVAYPADCIEILRAGPFLFSARSCNKWALGRVILCGDSAHVFPPFGGQGIVSGFRDALALSWRLQVACLPGCRDYESLLKSWYIERKQQLELSLAATVENGKNVTEGDPLKIFFRNTYLWLIQMVPSWKRWLEQGARREGMLKYTFKPGMHFLPDLGGGQILPQVYAASIAADESRQPENITFTDDRIFSASKTKPFQLVALPQTVTEIEEIGQQLASVGKLACDQISITEATIIVADPRASSSSHNSDDKAWKNDIIRIATAEEFAASKLCLGRPRPLYYDEYRIHKEFLGKKFLIVRPDRIVFAACRDTEELIQALKQINPVLNIEV